MNVPDNKIEEPIESIERKSWKELNHQEKGNIILFSSLGLFLLSITGTCLGFGFSILNTEPDAPTEIYKDGHSGCYDEHANLISLGSECYKYEFVESSNCYIISEIDVPASTSTIILNELYQGSNDSGMYLVKGLGYSNGENNIFSGDTGVLKTISTNTAYLSIGAYSLSNLVSLENVSFGDTSREYKMHVCNNAFENDTGLKNVRLGNALYEIGEEAFLNCTSLAEIRLSKKISVLGKNIFKGCDNLETIYYPNSKANWKNVTKDDDWLGVSKNVTVHCVDGDIQMQS